MPVSLKIVAIETFGSRAAFSFDFVGGCEKLSNIDGRRRRCGKRMIVMAKLTIRRGRSRGSWIGWRRGMARWLIGRGAWWAGCGAYVWLLAVVGAYNEKQK